MNEHGFIYLSHKDILKIIPSRKELITSLENVLVEHAEGHYENPPKPGIHPGRNAFIHAMPGYLPRKKTAGMKWVSGFFDNYQKGLPSIMGLIMLNDVSTGQIIAVMDCREITALRTAAVTAIASKYLAKKNAEVVGIIGAGVQGRESVFALLETMDSLKTVRVFDTKSDTLKEYVAYMRENVQLTVEAGDDSQDVIESADIVITATGKIDKPTFKKEWVNHGALVLPVHVQGWDKDFPKAVDKFIVDDWTQFSSIQNGENGYYTSCPNPYAELGEIVSGKKPGREKDEERIVDCNFGMAIHDVCIAYDIFEKAKKMGIGTYLTLD